MMPKKIQKIDRWFAFCDYCNHRQIIEQVDDTSLTEVKRVAIPGGSPDLDPVNNAIKIKPSKPRTKMVKCPKCGRGTVLKPLPPAYLNAYHEIDAEERKKQEEIEKIQRLEDGKPIKREREEEFLG